MGVNEGRGVIEGVTGWLVVARMMRAGTLWISVACGIGVVTGALVGVFNQGRKAMACEDAVGLTVRMAAPAMKVSKMIPSKIHSKIRCG